MKKIPVFFIIFLLIGTTNVYAKEKPSLTEKELILDINEKFNINIKNKIKKSKYYWTSSNTDIATVNSKNGMVKAVGGGTTDIQCKITLPSGDTLKLHCQVDVTPPFFSYDYMAHAGGGYEETIYNNTEEAILNSIENGLGFIEIDMLLTADNRLVCSHGWDRATYKATGIDYMGTPTYDEFMSWKIKGKYNTIDASTVIDIMNDYPDLLIEIDLKKYSSKKTKLMIEQLVELVKGNESILDRILMQFTSETAYFAIEEVYNFKYYQYFTYKSQIADEIKDVIKFCKDNKIVSMAVNYTVLTDDMIKEIMSNNLYLLVFTIDDKELAEELISKGVDTICTNFIK